MKCGTALFNVPCMSRVTFRLATTDDLEQLSKFRASMQIEVNSIRDGAAPDAFMQEAREYFRRSILNQSYIGVIAQVDEKWVANAGVVIYEKPPSIPLGRSKVGYVTNVYTCPQARGEGIATQLMSYAVEQLKLMGISKLHLGTTDEGKGVYERVGFGPGKFPPLEMRLSP